MSHPSSDPRLGTEVARTGRHVQRYQGRPCTAWSDRKVFALAFIGCLSGAAMAFAAGLVAARWLRGGDPTWAVLALALGILACLPLDAALTAATAAGRQSWAGSLQPGWVSHGRLRHLG